MKTLLILLMAATAYGSTAWENSLADADARATIAAECSNNPDEIRAVCWVVKNRAYQRHMTPNQVVAQRGQFMAYQHRNNSKFDARRSLVNQIWKEEGNKQPWTQFRSYQKTGWKKIGKQYFGI